MTQGMALNMASNIMRRRAVAPVPAHGLPLRAAAWGVALFVAACLGSPSAGAQSGLSTDSVDVDLSVLSDGGGARAAGVITVPGQRPLLVPGPESARSQIFVRPKNRAQAGAMAGTAPPAPAAGAVPKQAPVAAVQQARKPAPRKAPKQKAPAAASPATGKPPPPPAMAQPRPAKPATARNAPPPPPTPPAVVAPKKTVAPKPLEPAPKQTQTAGLPPSKGPSKDKAGAKASDTRVVFSGDDGKMPDSARDALRKLVADIKQQENLRLRLQSYAGGKGISTRTARRTSLSRALAVRSFLIENGVRSTRIEVRALGDKTKEKPINRVDVSVIER